MRRNCRKECGNIHSVPKWSKVRQWSVVIAIAICHQTTAIHRGKRTRQWCRHTHRNPKWDTLFSQQTRWIHPGHRRVSGWGQSDHRILTNGNNKRLNPAGKPLAGFDQVNLLRLVNSDCEMMMTMIEKEESVGMTANIQGERKAEWISFYQNTSLMKDGISRTDRSW